MRAIILVVLAAWILVPLVWHIGIGIVGFTATGHTRHGWPGALCYGALYIIILLVCLALTALLAAAALIGLIALLAHWRG